MGHGFEECGDGVWKVEDKQWGSWMLAQRRTVAYTPPTKDMRAPRVGRGRTRGEMARGGTTPRKRSSVTPPVFSYSNFVIRLQ